MAKSDKFGKREKKIRKRLFHLLVNLIGERSDKSSAEAACAELQAKALPLLRFLGGKVDYPGMHASTVKRMDWKVKRGRMKGFLGILGPMAFSLLELNSEKFSAAIKSKKFELAKVKSLVRKKVGKPYVIARLKTRK